MKEKKKKPSVMEDLRFIGILVGLSTSVTLLLILVGFLVLQIPLRTESKIRKGKFKILALITLLAVCVLLSSLLDALALHQIGDVNLQFDVSAGFLTASVMIHILLLYFRTSPILIPDGWRRPIKIMIVLMLICGVLNNVLTQVSSGFLGGIVAVLYAGVVIFLDVLYNTFFFQYALDSKKFDSSNGFDSQNLIISKFSLFSIIFALLGLVIFAVGQFTVADRAGVGFLKFRLYMAFDRVPMAIVVVIWMALMMRLDRLKEEGNADRRSQTDLHLMKSSKTIELTGISKMEGTMTDGFLSNSREREFTKVTTRSDSGNKSLTGSNLHSIS
jgi:hypothetical protein